ncbi:histone methyltransferase [Scheffersomyces coipomensis]|uniref:histone methyltransferase n=1 Tax=Scheffersomyces coipomensis TaxID=1788519 RepID=UPI00315DEB5C
MSYNNNYGYRGYNNGYRDTYKRGGYNRQGNGSDYQYGGSNGGSGYQNGGGSRSHHHYQSNNDNRYVPSNSSVESESTTPISKPPTGPKGLNSEVNSPLPNSSRAESVNADVSRGSDPKTGKNDKDSDFARLSHHVDFTRKIKFHSDSDPRKNYKVIYDPEFDKSLTTKEEKKTRSKKTRFNGESVNDNELNDPRLSNIVQYFQKPNKKSKKFPYKHLPQPKFIFDKDSLGPAPQTELVVWDLPSSITEVYLSNFIKGFGDPIKEVKFINDPEFAVPLGVATFKFQGNPEKSQRLAKTLIKKVATDRIKIDGESLNIGLNDHDGTLLNKRVKTASDKLKSLKIKLGREERIKRQNEQQEMLKKAELLKKKEEQAKKEKEKADAAAAAEMAASDSNKSTNAKSAAESLSITKFKPSTTTLSIRHHHRVVEGIFLPKDLKKYVKDRPYILIPDKFVSTKKVSSSDIKRVLSKYDWTRVLSDRTGFYIVFNSLKECERCFVNEDGRKYFEYNLFMELSVPEGYDINKNESDDEDFFESATKQNDVIDEATNMLVKEFQSFLSKDIRERIIAPAILDLLNHDKYPKLMEELKSKELQSKKVIPEPINLNSQLKKDALTLLTKKRTEQQSQQHHQSLPSFKKKEEGGGRRLSQSKPGKKNSLIPMQHALNFDHDSDDEDEIEDDLSRSLTPVARSLKRERSLTEDTVISDDNEEGTKKKAKTAALAFYDSSSSEEEDEEEEEVSLQEVKEEVEVDVKDEVKDEKMDITQEEDYTNVEFKYHPTEVGPVTVYEEYPYSSKEPFDLEVLQQFIKDDEDLKYAKEVLADVDEKSNNFSFNNIDYWAWKEQDLKRSSNEVLGEIDIEKLDSKFESKSGSFKSEGFKKIADEDKAEYLPHRRKLNQPLKTILHEDDYDDDFNNNNNNNNTNKNSDNVNNGNVNNNVNTNGGNANTNNNNNNNNNNSSANNNNNNAIQSSRVNRANNRRFAADITAQLGNETEVLSLNALTKRKKPVSFARSAIHNWGLYALEPIAAKEMIIEYVGESIRQQVAENREKSYLKTGIGSSYLFRIDENTVIDATKKGGIARFINHCCSPSCTAKIIKVEGSKRIVIYALRDIEANEELTYDYKFERETNDAERIRCLCGAPGCKGYLN